VLFCVVVKEDRPMSRVCLYVYMFRFTYAGITPVAGSIFRPLSQTHISKSELKNGHISILLCFSSNPSKHVGKVFLCGRS